MSGYEEEHNIDRSAANQPQERPRRPDLSSFFSTLELIDTSGSGRNHNNPQALPIPANVSAAYRQLANSYQILLGETEGVYIPQGQQHDGASNELLGNLINELMQSADDPPRQPHGLPETFFDELERVPKKSLKHGDVCPICSNPFLEDKYPLVVQLPCNKSHIFDLECIKPWLKLNTTCPLDRKDLEKKKEPPKPVAKEDEEEDYDSMYG